MLACGCAGVLTLARVPTPSSPVSERKRARKRKIARKRKLARKRKIARKRKTEREKE